MDDRLPSQNPLSVGPCFALADKEGGEDVSRSMITASRSAGFAAEAAEAGV